MTKRGAMNEAEQIAKADQRAMEQALKATRLRAQAAEKTRKEDARRKIIVGGAVIQLMRADASLRSRVRSALDEHFASTPDDVELFAKVRFWQTLEAAKAESEEDVALERFFDEKVEPSPAPGKKGTGAARTAEKTNGVSPRVGAHDVPDASLSVGAGGVS